MAEAADVVFEYLEKQNRPFSAGEIHNNLQNEYGLGKTLVQKALDKMTAEGSVIEKTYGKSKIYFADQKNVLVVPEAEVKNMESKLQAYTNEYQETSKEARKLEGQLAVLEKQMTMKEIESRTKQVLEEVSQLESRLSRLKDAAKGVDPEQNKKVRAERGKLVGEWKTRKRLANTALDLIMEGYPESKKKLMDKMGIETDEANDAVIPKDV